jgi:hypothetical protein
MQTLVQLDESLLEKAQQLSGLKENALLFQEALLALIQRESARCLAEMGGTSPELESVPRRQESNNDSR